MAYYNQQPITTAFAVVMGVVLVLLVVAPPPQAEAEAAMSCGTVVQRIASCLGYVTTTGSGPVPPGCCAGIVALNDRQTVCQCLKSAAAQIKNLNPVVAASLPDKCGVSIPFKLDPSIDCSKVR